MAYLRNDVRFKRKANVIVLIAIAAAASCCFVEAAESSKPVTVMNQSGIRMSLVAKQPGIVTPTGIDVDKLGHVWCVASHTHFRPKNYDGPVHDEVLVFDAKGNRRVFYNKTDATMDLELGENGWVYLAQRDRVVRVRDTDGDGIGDTQQDIAVLKTESTYPHNGLSGLAWHPSGDLIFAMGENFWKPWVLTGVDGSKVTGSGEGGIFRCKADGTKLRRIAKGFWNPFGVCVRADGEIFAVENDPGTRPPCRLIHVVEDGDYGYQRLYGRAPYHPFVGWDGELRGTLPMLHSIGEAPCGVAPLGGGLLVGSWSDHRIDFYPLQRKGASFETKRVVLVKGDDTFRPTCIVRVTDQLFYIADWAYGSYQLHKQGRIWKLEIDPKAAAKWLKPAKPSPLNHASLLANKLREDRGEMKEQDLFEYASSPDPFIAHAAISPLSLRASNWTYKIVSQMSVRDRLAAVLAIKKAMPKDEAFARQLLSDPSTEVQFETLRWIADEQLIALLSDVEKVLQRKKISTRMFEACLATLNTLRGNPRAGISDAKMLLARVRDVKAPYSIRANALRLMLPTGRGVTPKLLAELLSHGDEVLSLEVIRTLAAMRTDAARTMLAKVAGDEDLSAIERGEAVIGLAGAADENKKLLLRLANNSEVALREEALRALRSTSLNRAQRSTIKQLGTRHKTSSDLISALLDPASLAKGRPALTDVAAWREKLSSLTSKADVQAGRRIFFSEKVGNCARCHRYQGRGNIVGPDLSVVGARDDKEWLLRSILEPNRDLSPQYRPWLVELEDGTQFTGFPLRNGGSTGKEFYRDANGQEKGLLKKAIVSRRELKTSIMPSALVHAMTDRELRDLLAFLESDGEKD